MQWNNKYLLFAVVFLVSPFLNAQQIKVFNGMGDGQELIVPPSTVDSTPFAPFIVRDIIITGNKRTKEQIILREVPFKKGDYYQLQGLVEKFEDARRQLMNTSLFHEVIVALKSFEGYNVDILITVKERWYIFPIPYFNIVSRNFNEWVNDHGASLNRVNYGLKLTHNNATGRMDKLKFSVTNGYTRQLGLQYQRPYFEKSMKWGFNVGLNAGKNRDISYNTINNKAAILDSSEDYVHSFFRANAEVTYRRAIKTVHRFGFAYTHESVGDTVVHLNPAFYNDGKSNISFPELYYSMSYLDQDYNPYPLQGYAAEFTLSKKGFNKEVNMWQVTAKGSGTWPLNAKMYFNARAVGSIKLPFKQPFYNQRFLGYADMEMQGYEMYIIDGVAGGYVKATLGRELFNFNINLPPIKYTKLTRIPFRIYGKIYGNAGYVHNPYPNGNTLNNKTLFSGGFGVDIITVYDFVIKLEYSFNPLGQNGLYLHRKNQF